MNIRITFLSLVVLLLAAPARAELYAVVEIESHITGRPSSEREIHFLSENDLRTGILSRTSLAADWKSPRDCIKTGRAVEAYIADFFTSLPEKLGTGQSPEETTAVIKQLIDSFDIQFRCVDSRTILEDHPGFFIRDLPPAHYYLLRYVGSSFSLTEMETMDGCKMALKQYTDLVGRQAQCGKSFQSILYK